MVRVRPARCFAGILFLSACGGGGGGDTPAPPPTSDAGPCTDPGCVSNPDCRLYSACGECVRHGHCGWCNGTCTSGSDQGPDRAGLCGDAWLGDWVYESPAECGASPVTGASLWSEAETFMVGLAPGADRAAIEGELRGRGFLVEWLSDSLARVTVPTDHVGPVVDIDGVLLDLGDGGIEYFVLEDPTETPGSLQILVGGGVLARLQQAWERFRASGTAEPTSITLPTGLETAETLVLGPTDVRTETFTATVTNARGDAPLEVDADEVAVFEGLGLHTTSGLAVAEAETGYALEGYLAAETGRFEITAPATLPRNMICYLRGECVVVTLRKLPPENASEAWCSAVEAPEEESSGAPPPPPPAPTPPPSDTLCRRIDMLIDLDREFLAAHNDDLRRAEAKAYAVFAIARRPYRYEFALNLGISRLHIWQVDDGMNGGGTSTLLKFGMLSSAIGATDTYALAHLFSGRDQFDAETGGLAWLGALCNPGLGISAGLRHGRYFPDTVIHEIGHNLNAKHEFELEESEADCWNRDLVMCYSSDKLWEFSPTNEARVRSHLSRWGWMCTTETGARCSEPPASPMVSGLTASNGTQDCVVKLGWSKLSPSDREASSGIFIYRSSSADGPFEWVGTALETHRGYTDDSVEPGVTYYYKVQARVFSHGGPMTAAVAGRTSDRACAPAIQSVDFPTPMLARLTWAARRQTPAGVLVDLHRCVGACPRESVCTEGYRIRSSLATTLTLEDADVVPGLVYHYGLSITGASSPMCEIFSAHDPQEAPGSVAASDEAFTDRIELTWTRPSRGTTTDYQVFRSTVAGHACVAAERLARTGSGDTTVYADTAAAADTTFYYSVAAVGGVYRPGEENLLGACSAVDTGRRRRLDLPGTSAGFSASDGTHTDRVLLRWPPPVETSPTTIELFRSDTGGRPCDAATRIHSGPASAGAFDDTASLARGQDFYYSARFVNADGPGDCSADAGWRKLLAPTIGASPDGDPANQITIAGGYACEGRYLRVLRGTSASPLAARVIYDWDLLEGDSCHGLWRGTDATADPGETYYYWAQSALDRYGRRPSDLSAPNTAMRRLPAPTGVRASDGTVAGHMEVTFDTPAGTRYARAYRSLGSDPATATPGSPWMSVRASSTITLDVSAIDGSIANHYVWVRVSTTLGDAGASPPGGPDTGHIAR